MPQNIAIRLNVEGGATLKRELEEAGRTGQQAFTTVGTAADAAGAAADRLRQKTTEAAAAAAAARDAQAAAAGRAPSAPPVAPSPPPVAPPAPSAPSARVIESVRRDIDEEYRRGQQFARAESAIGAGAASGRYDATERDRLLNLAREKYRVGNDNNRLRADQITNLTYQGGDIFSQLGSGTSLSTIALQQGPQIAGVFSGGQGSIRGAITQASEAVTGFASRIGLVGGAIGAVSAVVGTGVVALSSYREGQRAVEQSLNGIGRASGATVGQINAVAQASAAGAGVSVSSAREMASEFASTGKIGAAMYADLIGTTRDFALTTGQELPDATRALATAFADPAKGAETLNAQLGFLDATTLESIQRLQQQGDRLGAQRLLFDAYSTSVVRANEKLGFFGRQWQDFKNTTSNEVDGIGRFIDRGFGGGSAEERLATLQAQLRRNEGARGSFGGLLNPLFDYDAGVIREQITKLQAEIDKAAKEGSTRSLAQRSQEIGNIAKAMNPAQQLIEQIEDRAKNFAKFLNVEGGIDKDGSIRRTMDALVAQGKVLREDLIAGGTQFAQGLRDAQANLRLVGFSESGRNIAGIGKRADDEIQALTTQNLDPAVRDAQIVAIRERQRIETETARQTYTNQAGAYATSLRDVPEQYRGRLQTAADARGIDPSLLASVFYMESRFRPEVIDGRVKSKAGAVGPFQFMPPTAAQYGVDPLDFDSSADGAARLLRDRLKARNGNVALALADYNWGQGNVNDVDKDPARFPKETRKYIASIMQQAPNTADRVQDLEANARSLSLANDNLRANTELYGKNGLQLDATTRANAMLAEQSARGVSATDALKASIGQFATESATIAQRQRLTQFASDIGFDREQLGRTTSEQGAYARARSMVGDTSSEGAKFIIEQLQMNDNLRQTRDLASGVFSGMLSDLRQGVSAATLLGNVTNRFADRLFSLASDRVISGLLGSFLGGGSSANAPLPGAQGPTLASGGLLSTITKFFGFDEGGFTGPGARLEPAGIVHRGEYVFDQDSVRRMGVRNLDAMRKQLRGYDGGGYVGPWGGGMSGTQNSVASTPVQLTINNVPADHTATATTTQGPMGTTIDVTLEKALNALVADGRLDKVMRRRFGAKATGGA